MNGSDSMLLYGANIVLTNTMKYSRNENEAWLYSLNGKIDSICKSKEYLIRAVEFKKNKIGLVVLVKNYKSRDEDLKKEIERIVVRELRGESIQKIDLREMTASQFSSILNKYSSRHLKKDQTIIRIQELLPNIPNNQFNHNIEIWEEILKVPKRTNFKAKAKKIKADTTLMEEMNRIYSETHPKQYRGIPVHYKITANSLENAREIIYVLMQGLHVNNRLLSKRVTHIKLTSLQDIMDSTVDKVFKLGGGGCIVLDFFKEPIKQYENQWRDNYNDEEGWDFWNGDNVNDIWDFGCWDPSEGMKAVKTLTSMIEKHMHETQLVFVENAKYPETSQTLFRTLEGKINLIEIKEGLNGIQAQQCYEEMMVKASLAEYDTGEMLFKENQFYSQEDVANQFQKFYRECMTDKVYTEYSADKLKKKKEDEETISAREKLQRLIGLNDVKQMMDNIISVHKANEMRSAFNGKEVRISGHMLFSGNPGTAKTTVARLVAQIMKEEGILKTGKFVECGRADLVGQYVGWTAVQVKEKFRLARGGVLFIDEAYSLVDDSNTFGDEAINTIVAEMENMRGEIVVIFAGYPEKMKTFLEKNEGLKSRISHYINFSNYTPEELLEILEKLAEDRDLILNDNAKSRALEIFKRVYREADFGNGRFVRNLLERAILRQSSRIAPIPKEKVRKEQLFELREEDFVYENILENEKEKQRIGFML